MKPSKQKRSATKTASWCSVPSLCFLFLSLLLAGAGGILLLQPLGTQAQSPIPDMAIVGVDNTVEYIEKLNFLSGTQKGGTSRYASTGTLEGTLVASGTVQVGTTNQVDKATSFVGGGSGNIVRAENAVIVGGQGNQIGTNATNGVIFGGYGNRLMSTTTHSLLAGGSGNTLSGEASLILGGEGNTNYGGIILGMKNNTIAGGKNNLIIGANVTIPNTISNTFVWSTTPNGFSPTIGNAFYVNTSGVGINTNAPQVVFDSKGAVKFGGVPTGTKCTADNVGLMRYKSGYLCVCSPKGYWINAIEGDLEAGAAACNADNNPNCTYDATTNDFVGNCTDDIIKPCHLAKHGFPYCFDIDFSTL